MSFDAHKNARNITLRGLDFALACKFDFQTAVIWIDSRKEYSEVRISALGLLDGRLYSLVFTETANGIRVISFRKANRREAKRYEQEIKT
ncbi:BrnT family toxin [Actimicrobium sp. CCI2.3]|uniref:BrnT family toxin n=1 Tax=Actimicrobium sp. CCI2.3 TaxID=3048616 RepID=UPI002AB42EED|nr:BrnT family toxin [Actimicrobium sp. CCI2.3]MDY7574410.1 BrnT family toxin [Actimicrobium sp. CCI2.3]MEB0022511.1 BrnT family toxin [Actimicrobium sp. CCI2.3]